MIEFIAIFLAGIIVGIFTGLLPALPVFTGPFLLYYIYNDLPLEHLLTFWLAVVSGSQFFGSVATITTKIPGEESSLVYIRDLDSLNQAEKNQLLHATALGSLVAGIISTVFLWFSVSYINVADMPWLNGLLFQITVYTLALAGFLFLDRRWWWTVALVVLGLLLGPKQNYALPDSWFQFEYLVQGYTFYMLVLGTIVIPDVVFSDHRPSSQANGFVAMRSKLVGVIQGLRSAVIGGIAGLIPGPSASLAAIAAYKTAGPDVKQRIVAAETANNSSVITCAIPLLILALPINQNTLIMSNIMDLKGITVWEALLEPSFVAGLRVLDLVAIALTAALLLFYVLSTHLIDVYVALIENLHHRMRWILLTIITALIGVDVWSNEITLGTYMVLLAAFTALGLLLKKYAVSPLPFLFAAILGDRLIWLYIQFFKLYT